MWIQSMAAVAALIFFGGQNTLAPGKQQVIDLPRVEHGHVLFVSVSGSGGGDIDCYLLVNHGHIVSKDEGNADSCYLGMYVGTEEPVKLWIVNHGDHTTTYQFKVNE